MEKVRPMDGVMKRQRRMNEVHCDVLNCFSIRLLCFLSAVYHRGNCHIDVSMWGRWEVKMCYSRQEKEIVGPLQTRIMDVDV